MDELSGDVINLLKKQSFVIVSTMEANGRIHASAKGIADIKKGKVYLIDLYNARTFENLRLNPTITITAVDEHQFCGYVLKGKASIIKEEDIDKGIIKNWEEKVINRISKRIIKNLKQDRSSQLHPESRFGRPKYLIEVSVEEVVDLTPSHLKKPASE
ncbi:MAG: pyridoxamine 5'-phosphate oxidase family protein [Candidatus Omnitrophota bacterium]